QVIWDQASGHSEDMASKAVPFGHDGFEARIAAIKSALGSGGSAAENVAMGFDTAQAVVSAWLNSAGHRANIEGNATRTGIAAARSNGGDWYYTQIFY
ncbi:MAG: CAP domain-containing protein, partial [Rhodospirillaceae bacterium]